MTPEAQQIAIAEACGFTDVGTDQHPAITYCIGQLDGLRTIVPEYLYDLNKCQEMTEHLNNDQQAEFVRLLTKVKTEDENHAHSWDVVFHSCLKASPADLCEAFLKAIGKWKDSQ